MHISFHLIVVPRDKHNNFNHNQRKIFYFYVIIFRFSQKNKLSRLCQTYQIWPLFHNFRFIFAIKSQKTFFSKKLASNLRFVFINPIDYKKVVVIPSKIYIYICTRSSKVCLVMSNIILAYFLPKNVEQFISNRC